MTVDATCVVGRVSCKNREKTLGFAAVKKTILANEIGSCISNLTLMNDARADVYFRIKILMVKPIPVYSWCTC